MRTVQCGGQRKLILGMRTTNEALKSNMEDNESLDIDGTPLTDLRVVDLKKELDKRNLSKSGTKKQLLERLKSVRYSHIVPLKCHGHHLNLDLDLTCVNKRDKKDCEGHKVLFR